MPKPFKKIKAFLNKPYRYAGFISLVLAGCFTYTLLDTFVIERSVAHVAESGTVLDSRAIAATPRPTNRFKSSTAEASPEAAESAPSASSGTKPKPSRKPGTQTEEAADAAQTAEPGSGSGTGESRKGSGSRKSASGRKGSGSGGSSTLSATAKPLTADQSYSDENITITLETLRIENTNVYVADVQLHSPALLKTALAKNLFGRNITDTTSGMAQEHGALLAINGDYYGFRNSGLVIRNGVLYRNTESDAHTLVVDTLGNFQIYETWDQVSQLDMSNLWQAFSFGPTLVKDGQIAVNPNSEISGQSMNSNPRTAIGQVGELHYLFVVSDGRTTENTGFSLYQLAQVFADRGCTVAYNLDGGGSATMVFNGEVVNQPTNGRSSGEREVSDIVYIGY